MTHQADTVFSLPIRVIEDIKNISQSARAASNVFVIHSCVQSDASVGAVLEAFSEIEHAGPQTVVCALVPSEIAAEIVQSVPDWLHYKMWIAVRSAFIDRGPRHLISSHLSLLIFAKYPSPLQHAKTRIGYTICPACKKTTKDYGGKKHTYNSFGTLMSDVWRDVKADLDSMPTAVLERLADVFAVCHHSYLYYYKCKNSSESRDDSHVINLPSAAFSSSLTHTRVQQGTARLLLGDCLHSMASMSDSSVDFAFADPPYNIAKKYDKWDDAIEVEKYFNWCDRWIAEMFRVVKPGGAVAILNIPQWCARHHSFMQKLGMFHEWIVWEGLSLPVRMIMPAHYGIVVFTKGQSRLLPGYTNQETESGAIYAQKEWYCVRAACIARRCRQGHLDREMSTDLWHDIHRLKHNSRRVDHPCQLPPSLMARLLSWYTYPGETVLDPFNGAATTSLVACQMGRNAIGCEMSPSYHEIATQRHNDLKFGIDPFKKTKRKISSKNSRVKRMSGRKYEIPKKTLQLDVRRIAKEIGRIPTRADVEEKSKYPIKYFDEYFVSWGEVCASARHDGMNENISESSQAGLFDNL